MKYGFIGCGNMGGAIARALSSTTKDIMVTDRSGKARNLAGELGIREMTFRGLFPLGRSSGADCPDLGQLPARVPSHFTFKTTCGIDNNISVEPDGTVYPCYAWKSPEMVTIQTSKLSTPKLSKKAGLVQSPICPLVI